MSSDTRRRAAEPDAEILVDLLEIYHARQLRDEVAAQVRRLRRLHRDADASDDGASLVELGCYYEALQLSLEHLLLALGDQQQS
ncbi:MAG: hypothetical protein AAGG11_06890 [Pseudomonadota bacterium]